MGSVELESLVREHQQMVFSLAYHFLRDRTRAEDLAQDVFLHLHQKLSELESPAHVKFWLRRVTAHRCIDESRRRKWRTTLPLENLPEPGLETNEDDFLRAGTLRKLVASLPERGRLVVILRYQEDLEPAEIAEILRVPLGTVKSQLHRALAMLRQKLKRTEQKAGVMTDDLETELREALRRKAPSRNLMPILPKVTPPAKRTRGWWTMPVAAALMAAAGLPAYHAQQQRRAKDQLVFALRLTAVKLERAKAHIRAVGTENQ